MIGLIRVAVIVLIAFLLYRVVKKWLAKLDTQKKAEAKKVANMVRCHYCDLHLPETEAIEKNHNWYCCKEHSQQDKS